MVRRDVVVVAIAVVTDGGSGGVMLSKKESNCSAGERESEKGIKGRCREKTRTLNWDVRTCSPRFTYKRDNPIIMALIGKKSLLQ
ncbi:hypothetical protein ACH5RR_028569 [Cinchona calisaya]|uniref:Secreted protein n=1 Tax=Cinchona calisaya TaxID=153742 RepID=A0ABD2YQE3_9GENT